MHDFLISPPKHDWEGFLCPQYRYEKIDKITEIKFLLTRNIYYAHVTLQNVSSNSRQINNQNGFLLVHDFGVNKSGLLFSRMKTRIS